MKIFFSAWKEESRKILLFSIRKITELKFLLFERRKIYKFGNLVYWKRGKFKNWIFSARKEENDRDFTLFDIFFSLMEVISKIRIFFSLKSGKVNKWTFFRFGTRKAYKIKPFEKKIKKWFLFSLKKRKIKKIGNPFF